MSPGAYVLLSDSLSVLWVLKDRPDLQIQGAGPGASQRKGQMACLLCHLVSIYTSLLTTQVQTVS